MSNTTISFPTKRGRPSFCPSPEVLAQLYDCYTCQEIATIYGVPVGTVRSWIVRTRAKLRKEAEEREARSDA